MSHGNLFLLDQLLIIKSLKESDEAAINLLPLLTNQEEQL